MNEYEMPHDEEEEDKPSVPDQLEAIFPKNVHGRYTVANMSQFRMAWAIVDDSAATREGLEKAFHDPASTEGIKKQAAKADMSVSMYIDAKAATSEELSQAKADLIHSYIRNTLQEYGLISEDS